MWLRKHGFVFTEANDGETDSDFVVAARGASAGDLTAGVYEGPFDRETLVRLGIAADVHFVERVSLYPELSTCVVNDPKCFSGLAYGRDILRRIPHRRGERSDPYFWQPDDARLAPYPVPVQVFTSAPGWRILARARFDATDQEHPIVISNGAVVLLGVPLFDIVARKHWMPPIVDGYYSLEHDPFTVEAELWLARLIRTAAAEAGMAAIELEPWPDGRVAAMSIRFDYDRDISTESLVSLLDLLERLGLKASWGFLLRLAPHEKMAQVLARGHEIVLHTEAPDRAGLLREVQTLRAAGWPLAGVTAHGGIGSAGHLGQVYFGWAADAGLQHADTLSRHTHVPHPMVIVTDGRIKTGPVFLPPVHHSLDRGTAPDAHYLDDLQKIVPERLKQGDHVTIMNHPDIHRPELEKLLTSLALGNVWSATHRQVTEWIAATRFGWRWNGKEQLGFVEPLPYDLVVRVVADSEPAKITVPCGATSVTWK